MPFPNRTRKIQKWKKKTQKGGKKLYSFVDDYTDEEIERIFCGGKLLTELVKPETVGETPQEKRPLFVIKWAPMASGKSSEKVMRIIRSLLEPLKLEECADVSSDKLVENLIPFRYKTTNAKMKNIRLKTNIGIRDFAHAVQLLQSIQVSLPVGDPLHTTINSILREYQEHTVWPLSPPETELFFDSLLQSQIRDTYNSFYRRTQNEDGRTLREKVVEFFPRAYAERVNIQYETAGLGYGEVGPPNTNQIVGKLRSLSKTLQRQMAATILKNSFADFLGEVVYNREELSESEESKEGEEALIPIGVRPGIREELFIPPEYRIVVVFPIVSIHELQRRGFVRAYQHLRHTTLYDVTAQQKADIVSYITDLIKTLISRSSRIRKEILREKVYEILSEEFARYALPPSEYVKDLQTIKMKAQNPDIPQLSFPFFRLASADLEKSVAQAFQYSVDYFLRQYIQIGRIEQVIYVNNN